MKLKSFRALVGKNKKTFGYAYWNPSNKTYRLGAGEIDGNTMRIWYTKIEYKGGP